MPPARREHPINAASVVGVGQAQGRKVDVLSIERESPWSLVKLRRQALIVYDTYRTAHPPKCKDGDLLLIHSCER